MLVSGHFKPVVDTDGLVQHVNMMAKLLRKHSKKFDSIAFRGISGGIIGPLLAIKMKKKMLIVRKDAGHSPWKVEGDYSAKNYIIIDDFIHSGETVKIIHNDIINGFVQYSKDSYMQFDPPNCVGIALYKHGNWEKNTRIKQALPSFPVDGFFVAYHHDYI